MKLFICPNSKTKLQKQQAIDCIQKLEKNQDIQCSLAEEKSLALFGQTSHCKFTAEKADLIVAVGGDGATLRAAQTAIACNKPLVGINSGRVGYLCAFQYAECDSLTSESFRNLVRTERSLLEISIKDKTTVALNDIVIAKSNFGVSVDLRVKAANYDVNYRCDGVIIATPTGSTAYTYSAGGPQFEWNSDKFIITPICERNRSKSLIIDNMNTVEVDVIRKSGRTTGVYADGEHIGNVSDSVLIQKHHRNLILLQRG